MIQLLDVDGTRHPHPFFDAYLADVTDDELRTFYRDMAVTRRFDDEATALQRQGQLALWVQSRGQEAAQVGSGRATAPQDYIVPTYREHAVARTRGVDFADILRLFRGVSNSGWDPREHNFHTYTLVLAAQVPHAVGYAMGIGRDGAVGNEDPARNEAVLGYFGDGSSTEGEVHEGMVFAASFTAPIVFFCQNNQWAISVPFDVQSRVPLSRRAAGYGFPGVRVDGNDVLAVHAVTRWALERARAGSGPALIEAFTYRLGAHTTADDPTKYRQASEEEEWAGKDPLVRFERYLRAQGLADDAFFADVAAEGDAVAAHVRETTLGMSLTGLDRAFDNVYGQPHPLVEEERRWHQQYEASFDDAGDGTH
ncbi:pyruvate dehydrogenase (acetyl-transferring) E1 component subunit alpha [Tersicoccus sp. Bi-70]|uniref:pyruvate dehydrogenase (acetyl-transferring) E1 component subunit alpha n=1 Tax=Tersicoccus sp. Bi-70 TaxID=1897634 RepID=UPI000977D1BF|nr:pyruvate dehydrogenase (acetyl-transferring) E1 component subunit alpha [Tersicoccus sp. Bi-70]OMH34551.1 pyruvate dehydrogenase (acetyl-transferring) E1 component subunit alpha [Tersicoccus sp. Bi-70]